MTSACQKATFDIGFDVTTPPEIPKFYFCRSITDNGDLRSVILPREVEMSKVLLIRQLYVYSFRSKHDSVIPTTYIDLFYQLKMIVRISTPTQRDNSETFKTWV